MGLPDIEHPKAIGAALVRPFFYVDQRHPELPIFGAALLLRFCSAKGRCLSTIEGVGLRTSAPSARQRPRPIVAVIVLAVFEQTYNGQAALIFVVAELKPAICRRTHDLKQHLIDGHEVRVECEGIITTRSGSRAWSAPIRSRIFISQPLRTAD